MKMRNKQMAAAVLWLLAAGIIAMPVQAQTVLEEVIVTAQKRQETLQDTPIAISVLGEGQLLQRGITGLSDLVDGAVPALKIQPFPNNPGTLVISMRGIGPADAGQVTKEPGVGIYLDNVYLGRSQGLGMDLVDLQRIEILRGPQGTLYGRNVVGGAVNMISRKPAGKFGIKQTLLHSSEYGDFKSLTHIDLPALANVSAKISYIQSESDGYVDNPRSGSHSENYNAYDKQGVRIALNWSAADKLVVDYVYDQSDSDIVQNYFQLQQTGRLRVYNIESGLIPDFTDPNLVGNVISGAYLANIRPFPADPEGFSDTARTAAYLPANQVKTEGHSLTVNWEPGDMTLRSITAYREMDQETHVNYLGIFGLGLTSDPDIGDQLSQQQFSQEFQFIGSALNERLQYVAGVYYFNEKVEELAGASHFSIGLAYVPLSRDPRMIRTSTIPVPLHGFGNFVPLDQPLQFPGTGRRNVKSETDSWAAYGQARYQWTDDFAVTLGWRYTNDKKDASRPLLNGQTDGQVSRIDDSNVSPMITLDYDWNDSLNTYVRWSSAYKSGGVNLRSATFRGYGKETLASVELGLKSDFWNRRARLNLAVFSSVYEDMQIDFSDPRDITISETFNASNGDVDIDGVEVDFSIVPTDGLVLTLNYNYLGWKLKQQPNPIANNALEEFHIPQAPRHSGSVALDYTFAPVSIGTLALHVDYVGQSGFFYTPHENFRHDSRDLLNARLSLADIRLGGDRGNLQVALWAKNLTDEEYVIYSFTFESTNGVSDAYGKPRTVGVELIYEY